MAVDPTWPEGTDVIATTANGGSLTRLFRAVGSMMLIHHWRVVSPPERGADGIWSVRLERANTDE